MLYKNRTLNRHRWTGGKVGLGGRTNDSLYILCSLLDCCNKDTKPTFPNRSIVSISRSATHPQWGCDTVFGQRPSAGCISSPRGSAKPFLLFYSDWQTMLYVCMYVYMVITCSKGKDQPGKVANLARGQLNREN